MQKQYKVTKKQLATYFSQSEETAIYPEGLTYAVLGLCGETHELIQDLSIHEAAHNLAIHTNKVECVNTENIVKEIGDIFWYIAAIYRETHKDTFVPIIHEIITQAVSRKYVPYELKVTTPDNYLSVKDKLRNHALATCEHMKKIIRIRYNKHQDTDLLEEHILQITIHTAIVAAAIVDLTMIYQVPLLKCLTTNIEKLRERKLTGELMFRKE